MCLFSIIKIRWRKKNAETRNGRGWSWIASGVGENWIRLNLIGAIIRGFHVGGGGGEWCSSACALKLITGLIMANNAQMWFAVPERHLGVVAVNDGNRRIMRIKYVQCDGDDFRWIQEMCDYSNYLSKYRKFLINWNFNWIIHQGLLQILKKLLQEFQ